MLSFLCRDPRRRARDSRASRDERKVKAEVDQFCREHVDPALCFATLDMCAVVAVLLSSFAGYVLLSPWDTDFPASKFGALVLLVIALSSAAAGSSIARAAIRWHLETEAKNALDRVRQTESKTPNA